MKILKFIYFFTLSIALFIIVYSIAFTYQLYSQIKTKIK
jgi:hypothetical protein